MTWFRMPLSVWALFITAILGVLALPCSRRGDHAVFDNVLGTHFFDRSRGSGLLWQHLFWFFGHPEVYILILPAMVWSPTSSRTAAASRSWLSLDGVRHHRIAFLGWIVWATTCS